MSVGQSELDELGRSYHRGDAVACPLCQSQLQIAERRYMPRVSVPVRFYCPMHGYLGESAPTELRTDWSDEDTRRMLGEYLRRGEARCPADHAKVSVLFVAGENESQLHMGCPSCGRMHDGVSPPKA